MPLGCPPQSTLPSTLLLLLLLQVAVLAIDMRSQRSKQRIMPQASQGRGHAAAGRAPPRGRFAMNAAPTRRAPSACTLSKTPPRRAALPCETAPVAAAACPKNWLALPLHSLALAPLNPLHPPAPHPCQPQASYDLLRRTVAGLQEGATPLHLVVLSGVPVIFPKVR